MKMAAALIGGIAGLVIVRFVFLGHVEVARVVAWVELEATDAFDQESDGAITELPIGVESLKVAWR